MQYLKGKLIFFKSTYFIIKNIILSKWDKITNETFFGSYKWCRIEEERPIELIMLFQFKTTFQEIVGVHEVKSSKIIDEAHS